MPYNVNNTEQLKNIINQLINAQLLPKIGKKVKETFIEVLKDSEIKDSTMDEAGYSRYVFYTVKNNECIIFIDFNVMQIHEQRQPSNYHEWGRFINTWDGAYGQKGGNTWNGKVLTLRLAEWLENGVAFGGTMIGNQPLMANQWFTLIEKKVKANLESWVIQALREMGFAKI